MQQSTVVEMPTERWIPGDEVLRRSLAVASVCATNHLERVPKDDPHSERSLTGGYRELLEGAS
jgi:hypothetical protein